MTRQCLCLAKARPKEQAGQVRDLVNAGDSGALHAASKPSADVGDVHEIKRLIPLKYTF